MPSIKMTGYGTYSMSALIAALLIAGCSGGTGPDDFVGTIDPAVVGVWYRIDSTRGDTPGPAASIHGLRIAEDGAVTDIAVLTSEGTLDIRTSPVQHWDITGAAGGRFIRSGFAAPYSFTDTGAYEVRGDTLFLAFGERLIGENLYVRGAIGEQVTEPVETGMTLNLEGWGSGGTLREDRVYPIPGAFVRKLSDRHLTFVAQSGRLSFQLPIDDFSGPGTYTIDRPQESFDNRSSGYTGIRVDMDDVIDLYLPDPARSNTITIETFDESAGVCSGTFSLNLANNAQQPHLLTSRSAQFSVPIYGN